MLTQTNFEEDGRRGTAASVKHFLQDTLGHFLWLSLFKPKNNWLTIFLT